MNGLRGVLGDEISLLQYELRRHPRFALPWSPDAAFGVPIDQSLGREHPIICDLKAARKLCMTQTLTMSNVLEPFLTVVTSEIVNSAITSTALACVERLVTECDLAMKEGDFPEFKFAEGLDDVVDSCKSCTFEAVDSTKDEAAHIRRAKVASRSVLAGLPDNISDATILTAFEICLQLVFSKRASDVLRREAEESMLKIVQGACGMDFNQDEYCDEAAVFSLDVIRKCLKDLRESNQQAADFSFEQTGVEPSFSKPPSVVPQHAFLTLGALLSDPSVTRTARERLVGLRLLNAAVRSLPKDCHPLPRQVLLTDASIAVLRCLGSVPPPPAVVLCSAMSTTGSICRKLGDSAAAFLFILFRTAFPGFTQMKSHAVLRELYLESIGAFITAPGLLPSVFAAIDCEPQLPVVAEGFLNILESSVQSEFPLVVQRSSSSSEFSSVMDVIASTDLQDIVHMELQPLASDQDESNAAAHVVTRAVSVITAKIMLDIVESICIRHKAFSQGRGQKVEESSVATVEEVTAQRRAQRAEKKKLRAVAEVFNAKMGNGTGEKVLKLVMESPIVSSSTSGTTVSAEERDGITVAQFLRMTPDLDKSHIGVVLGEPDEFSTCVLAKYTETFAFANVTFTDAIRIYLESFRLPGEAQKISRIMSSFADRYYKQNEPFGGPLSSADATYVLSYAVVMLNTDRHNDSVKKKMTVDDFVRNNRGINDGKDLDRGFLEGIYSSISEEEIKMSDEAGMDGLTRAHWRSLLLEFGAMEDPHRSFSDHRTIVLPKDADLHDEDVFRIICNGSIHAAFALLDEAEDTTEAQSALEGFTLIAKCAASYRIPNAIDLVIIMLASASRIRNTSLKGSVKEFGARIKAQMSAVSLFAVARQSADWIRSGGWKAVVDCVLSLHALDLLPPQLESDLCTYGDDIVDSDGNPPPSSKNIPSWWPARRLQSSNPSNGGETAKPGKAGNGIWSIFGGGGSNTDSVAEAIHPPEHLLLKSPEELKARELARNCILALTVEELIINETRFIRSDSLACLCTAISDSAPIASITKQSSGPGGSEKSYKEKGNGLNLDTATATSVSAFCIDWLCLVTLKNRDRLGLTWPHLHRLLMNSIHGRSESGPLVVVISAT
uniref:SEC7 domain-containing protein n=2 Tax=Rhodosorus marinus TaxID=101924 RepID=A0A7S2ZBM6_9RHOD|mmetsp:Transcript_13618/g.54561  ORF Transcript_13618/g.54561 Transcript_13618/m.54561 type:complete len:1122 (+) Transcript_13618:916-4281(+)